MKFFAHYLWNFCIYFLLYLTLINGEDPYKILGVGKYATSQEIRQAYKKLAKKWHPDKNLSQESEQKFVEIKQAYELLSDTERRKLYDQYGITEEDSHHFRKKYDYSNYRRFNTDPLEEFFGKHFHFEQDMGLYHKLSITTRYFEQTVIPRSSTLPYLIIFYNDWCFRCTRLIGAFKKLINNLEPLGIQFAAVNTAHEGQLLRKTGVSDIPALVLMLNGHSYIYRDTSFSPTKVVEFIRKKMPYRVEHKLNDDNIDEFLNGWSDNKVRVIVFEPRDQTRLRYLITAFSFRQKVAFGFVRTNCQNCNKILERFKIDPALDTVLIFNEEVTRPVASISMTEIPIQTLNNIISANQYLILPRLSSQEMLEGICPSEWNRPKKRLCVILITEDSDSHESVRTMLRSIALKSDYNQQRVRFAYIYKEKQSNFINSISKGSIKTNLLGLVVIWRRDASHIKYEWIDDADLNLKPNFEYNEESINTTKSKIDEVLQKLLKTSEALSYEAFVENLLDEHAQGILARLFSKLLYVADYLIDNIDREHILAIFSLIGTIAFMFAVGYVMVYFVRIEEESLKANGQLKNCDRSKLNNQTQELKLYELRAEKYNGMVRLLKPGCRTIILICDMQTRTKLIPPFHRAVWPYRKTKTLIFGHMLIEKGLEWYSELLRLSLCETKDLQINPRNCVGTVLALNGHRKYFCMFHAKHPESERGAKRMIKMTKQLSKYRPNDPEAGGLLESDDSDDSETEPTVLLEENLLDGLSNWLDRLFEGTTHRYYINYWPDFSTK